MIAEKVKQRALALLSDGTVARVLAWDAFEEENDLSPSVFSSTDELNGLVYNEFCGANLSKFCIECSKLDGKTLVLLKPCDTLSFKQLMKEHRLDREKFYIIGVGCKGMRSPESGELLFKCLTCKGKSFEVADEVIDDEEARKVPESNRFDEVAHLEAMTAEERFEFWRGELSRCIRCNACRNVCPACTCRKCVFDNPKSGVAAKANTTDFEENMFHIIRAYHVAGRCTDCGECSRVCPEHIPLHLLNRKFIKDIAELYGDDTAGIGDEERTSLTNYTLSDCEPSIVHKRGNE